MIEQRELSLKKDYGELLSMSDLSEVFHYPSVAAARKARERGKFPIELFQLPNRRGWFTTARAVAEFLCQMEVSTTSKKSVAGG